MTDIASYAEEFRVAQTKEGMRKQLEQMQIGSKLNTLDAGAQRAEVNRTLQAAFASNAAAKSDLDGLIAERDAYVQQIKGETAQQLTEQGRKLSDAMEQQNKARLRRNLVDLRADRDAIVLSVAKVSVGSVVQSGDELITLVPTDAPLEVEASIPARDAGFVQTGNKAVIKFDTFPYTTYGYATGTLQTVSADSFTGSQTGRDRPSRPNTSQTEANGGATFFRAALSMDEMKLHNLPAGFRMTPGMPVTADIKVGQAHSAGLPAVPRGAHPDEGCGNRDRCGRMGALRALRPVTSTAFRGIAPGLAAQSLASAGLRSRSANRSTRSIGCTRSGALRPRNETSRPSSASGGRPAVRQTSCETMASQLYSLHKDSSRAATLAASPRVVKVRLVP